MTSSNDFAELGRRNLNDWAAPVQSLHLATNASAGGLRVLWFFGASETLETIETMGQT